MTMALMVVGAVVVLWVTTAFNRIRDLTDEVESAWHRMTTHLRRRHDCSSQLVEEVGDVVDFEPQLLEAARHVTASARETLDRAGPEHGLRAAARSQGALSEVLARLKVTLARFPDWHPRRRIPVLLHDISSAEVAAGEALRAYNQTAQDLLVQCDRPVWTIVARIASAPRVGIWTDLAHTSSGPAPAIHEHESGQE